MKNVTDYHQIIATALTEVAESNRPERVKLLQSAALAELEMTLNRYAEQCYDPALLCTIANKKVCWITEATTKNEAQAILNPPASRYDGSKFQIYASRGRDDPLE